MHNKRDLVTSLIRAGGLYCLTAEKFSQGRSNVEVVTAMLAAGIKLVQYREKTKGMSAKLRECEQLRELTCQAGAAFIINDDVDLAVLVGADGVHVGQDDMPLKEVRKLMGNDMAIGLSTGSPPQAAQAVADGADYIGVGPIYATQTKKDAGIPVGLSYLDHVASKIDLPFVVIGGIKANNIAEVAAHGANCFAMITEIVAASDIAGRIQELRVVAGLD